MSVLSTESFMRYVRFTPAIGDPNGDLMAGGWAVRSYISNFEWIHRLSGNVGSVNYGRWSVSADPVYSGRNSLVSTMPTYVSSARAVVLAKVIPLTTHWIMGVRGSVVLTAVSAGTPSGFLTVGPQSIQKLSAVGNTVAHARPVQPWMVAFQVDAVSGLSYTGVSGAYVQTPYIYPPGADIFIEVEVDTVANLVRVWVDDLLVVDAAFAPSVLAAAKAAYDAGFAIMASGSGSTAGAQPQAVVRDIYCLQVDEVAPSVRLGPTTQVVGERPVEDVRTDFTRPVGFDSNASVAAMPVEPYPTVYLTADQAGQTDLYRVPGSTVAVAAAQVYAVAVKAQVANFAAAAHTVGAVVQSGEAEESGSMGTVAPGAGFSSKELFFNVNPATGMAWTPQDAADAAFGLTVLS